MRRQVRGERISSVSLPSSNFSKSQKKYNRHSRNYLITWFVGLCLVAFLIWAAVGLKVNTISVSDSTLEASILEIAKQETNRHLLAGNVLFIDKGRLSKVIKAQYRHVDRVDVKVNLLTRNMELRITLETAKLLWQSRGERYVVSAQGTVLEKTTLDNNSLPLVVDSTNLPITIGQAIASTSFIEFLTKLTTEFALQTKLTIRQLRLSETPRELFVDTDKSFYIKFDTETDIMAQLDNVKQVLESTNGGANISQYIDVRLPYKAYYR